MSANPTSNAYFGSCYLCYHPSITNIDQAQCVSLRNGKSP